MIPSDVTPAETAEAMIEQTYDALEGSEDLMDYHARHGTPSLLILTQYNPRIAMDSVERFRSEIEGKSVIEIGAGVGFLAIEMARVAKSVIAIESDPAWSWIFTKALYQQKPVNLSWIFGRAENFVGILHADVAVVFTRSGVKGMRVIAETMADRVIFPLDKPALVQVE